MHLKSMGINAGYKKNLCKTRQQGKPPLEIVLKNSEYSIHSCAWNSGALIQALNLCSSSLAVPIESVRSQHQAEMRIINFNF